MQVWLTTLEVERMTGLSQRTIQRKCARGEIKCTQFPGKIMILSSDADEWIEKHRKSGDIRDIDDIDDSDQTKSHLQAS